MARNPRRHGAAPGPEGRPGTPADDLRRKAAESPLATALIWDEGRIRYQELDRAADAAADRLQAAGLLPGAVVTLSMLPQPNAIAALFGLWKAGGVAVPLHEKLTDPEMTHALRLVRPAFHRDVQNVFSPVEGVKRGGDPPLYFGPSPGVIALLLTSGSSGAPRAVGFTRGAFAASAAGAAHRLGLAPRDQWGLCLSLGHIGGLALLLRAIMTGSAVRCWRSFNADAVARAVLRNEVTHLSLVPVMLRRLLKRLGGRRVPSSFRCALIGGAATPASLLREALEAGFPVAPTWGMTETTSQIATGPPELARRTPDAVGRPLPGLEVRTGPKGTLEVRGRTLASILIREPGAHPEPLPVDPEGWFSTADRGDVDGEGRVRIHGRHDRGILTGGLSVDPGEVERVIEALPGVTEAVVFGVPDAEWGEVVAAVVETDGKPTVEDVDRQCRERLLRGRCPSRIFVVDALPRSYTGKVRRSLVVERFGPVATPAGSNP